MTQHADATGRWREQLAAGLEQSGIGLDDGQIERLVAYLALLQKWNRAYNLTAVRDPAQMVGRQLLDSLSILPWLDNGPVLDVGSGAGLPGIPLAVARPDLDFSLLDSNGKKTRFVRQAVAELGLDRVSVIRARAEEIAPGDGFNCICSRAFATLADMVGATRHLLRPDGVWLAMKGVDPRDEIGALPAGLQTEVIALDVPGEPGRRHLVRMRASGSPIEPESGGPTLTPPSTRL